MPVNKKAGESKNDFISRCISHEVNKGHEQQQAIAICESLWTTSQRIEERLSKVREYRLKCKPKKK